MARVRRPDGSWHFTRSTSIGELAEEAAKHLPCDVIYSFVPDGFGFSLQPVGVFTLDVKPFQPEDLQSPVRPQVKPPAPIEEEPVVIDDTPSGIKEVNPPQGIPDRFLFEGPIPTKTQQELLAERGLEIAPEKPEVRRRTRKAKPAPSFTDADLPDDDNELPRPVGRGQIQITGISQATEAEAMAASKQIFK